MIEPMCASLGHSRPPPQRGEWQTRLLAPRGRLVYFAGQGFDRSQLPDDLVVSLVASTLARSGPLVIMSRQ